MKIIVIGDSHGNISNLKHVMGFAKNIDAKAIVHTGDWNNLQSFETVSSYDIPLYTCLGNADIAPDIKDMLQNKVQFEIDGIKIGVIHKLTNSEIEFLKGKDMVFTGHYHSQKEWEISGTRIIRPGALENDINFAVFDTKTKMVEFVHD